MSIVINGATFELPDESTGQKTDLYNPAFVALAGLPGNSGAAWTAWVPTWTNLTIAGSTVTAKYIKIGKLIVCRLSVVLGANLPTGAVTFSLPVTAAAYPGLSDRMPLGTAHCYDSSPVGYYSAYITLSSTTVVLIAPIATAAAFATATGLSGTVPFTWATGDEIHATFSYESG